MQDVNKVFLIGRLGADPIQKETKTGLVVVHLSLATSRLLRSQYEDAPSEEETGEGAGERDGDAERKARETIWHRVVVWGKQAENCVKYLKKGHTVFVEGSIRCHKYETKKGESRLFFEVNANSVVFLHASRRVTQEEPMEIYG